jgi:hypothetical protein
LRWPSRIACLVARAARRAFPSVLGAGAELKPSVSATADDRFAGSMSSGLYDRVGDKSVAGAEAGQVLARPPDSGRRVAVRGCSSDDARSVAPDFFDDVDMAARALGLCHET